MAAFATGADWSFAGIPEPVTSNDNASTVLRAGIEPESDALPPKQADYHVGRTPKAEAPSYETPPKTATSPVETPLRAATPPAQNSGNNDNSQQRSSARRWLPRQCRICLDIVQPTFKMSELPLPAALQPRPRVTYISEDGGRLLKPCKCKGTQKYVHEDCLQQWRMADVSQKRNFYECPTCRYRYNLERLTWASHISSTASQIGLTLAILFSTIFVLGFVADPVINLYLDPVYTIATRGGPTGSLIFEDDAAGWAEHFGKGLVSLGLMGFAKLLFTISPWRILQGNFGGGGGRAGGNGRDRISQTTWLLILIGVITFLAAVWKAVRAWSRKTLQAAGERVLDVPGSTDDDDYDPDANTEQ